MKIRTDFVTNSSSASFIVATNLSGEEMLERIFNLDMTIEDKQVIKQLLGGGSMDAHKMSSCVLKILHTILPFKDDDGDYIEMAWLDEGTGNVRYKHIFVYRVEQYGYGWTELFEFLEKSKTEKEIFVKHCYWD